jgi:2-haloacid dehalogenase
LTEFKGVIVSGVVRLLKPDPAIYNLLAETYQLDLRRCVFIDDSRPNYETALSLGMSAIHFTGPEDTRVRLQALGFDV